MRVRLRARTRRRRQVGISVVVRRCHRYESERQRTLRAQLRCRLRPHGIRQKQQRIFPPPRLRNHRWIESNSRYGNRKCPFAATGSTPLSACPLRLNRRIGKCAGPSKPRKSSCEHILAVVDYQSYSATVARDGHKLIRPATWARPRQQLRSRATAYRRDTDAQHVDPPFVEIEQVGVEQRTDEVLHHDHQADP